MLIAAFLLFLLIGLLDPPLVFGGAYYIGLILIYVCMIVGICVGLFYGLVIFVL